MQERVFSSISIPGLPTRPVYDSRVEFGIRHLLEVDQGLAPRTSLTGIVETICDEFVPVKNVKPAREGGFEFTLDRMGKATMNLGGGANVVRALSPYTKLDVYTRVGALDATPIKRLFKDLPTTVHTHMIIDADSITPKKTRYTDGGRVVATLNKEPDTIGHTAEKDLIERIRRHRAKHPRTNFFVSDYGRRSLTPAILEAINEGQTDLHKKTPIIVDPRPQEFSWTKYNLDEAILKPNKQEAMDILQFAFGKSDRKIKRIIEDLKTNETVKIKRAASEATEKVLEALPRLHGVLITLDSAGAVYRARNNGDSEYFDTIPVKTINPSGAGDIVTASLAILQPNIGLPSAIATSLHLASLSTEEPNTSTLNGKLLQALQDRLGMQ